MLAPPILHITTTDTALISLCNHYWDISPREDIPYYYFTYRVQAIADAFGYRSARAVTDQVSALCRASVSCYLCKRELVLRIRSEYVGLHDNEAMLHDKTLRGIVCQECREALSPSRFIKSLLHKSIGIHYLMLKNTYAHVLIDFHLSNLIVEAGIPQYVKEMSFWDMRYYAATRFSFVVYNSTDLKPHLVIDNLSSGLTQESHWQQKQDFREAVLKYVGIPYYVFPRDQFKVYNREVLAFLKKHNNQDIQRGN